MGSLSQLEHWTTAYAFTAHHLPAHSELKQIYLDYTRHLPFKDVVTSTIKSAGMLSEWPSHLVYRALDHVMKDHFRKKLCQWKIEFPRPSASDCLPPTPTKIIHFAAADANSGSIDGTYKVHEHLMGLELGWDLEDDRNPVFQQGLQVMYGDQKTIENIQSTKVEQQESISLYNRRRWLLPVPGLFHVQMNLGGVILRKHWAPNEAAGETAAQDTRHALLRDIQFLGYKGFSQERSPWHSLDALINVSFNARVVATWLQCLEYKGVVSRSSIINEDSLCTFIQDTMEQSEFEDSLNMAQHILFSNDARKGVIPSTTKPYIRSDILKWPNHMITLARFMQPMQAYLVFRFAIKYGNLKAIECILPLLILLFLGSRKHKCGRELLYLMWSLHHSVSDEKLRAAIASTLVINISGRGDSFIPPDRHMEHINRLLQDDINAHKNSTHDWTTILRSYARLAPYYGKLRKAMEQAVDFKVSGKHSKRSTSFDVFSMALQMWKDGYVDWNNHSSGQFLCDHVAADGAILLPAAVDAFNRDVVDKQAGGMFNIPDNEKAPEEDAENDEEGYNSQEIEEEVFATEECFYFGD